MPPAVSFARALLYLQASIWGLLCVVVIYALHPSGHTALALSAAAVLGALAGAKAWLGQRLSRRADWTRQVVVVVEWAMGCGGALLTFPLLVPNGGVMLAVPFAVGSGLSLIAAIGLTKPPARQYFSRPSSEVTREKPAPRPDDEDSAPFWRLIPTVGVA